MASRIDSSQNRNLYVGTGTEVAVNDGNAIVTGNVGIGVTGPVAPLDVFGAAVQNGSTPGIKLSSSNTQQTVFAIGNTGTRQYELAVGGTTSSVPGAFYIYDNNATDFRITLATSGNVGIGTTSPLAWLSVGSGSLADTNVPVQISTSGGTSQKWFGVNKNGSYGLLMGYLEGGSIGDGGAGAYIRNITEDPLYFMVSNSDLAMTILANKNVGIGTTSPDAKLTVSNGGAAGLEFFPEYTTNNNLINSYNRSSTAYLTIETRASEHYWDIGTTNKMSLNSSGNLNVNGEIQGDSFSGPGQGLDNLLPLGVYSTTPGTAGVLIKTNIASNNYGFIFGTINLEQFNFTSVQRIQLSATVASNGTVVTKAATSDIAITMKLFHVGGYWHIHLPTASTYVTASAYIYTGAGYQGQAKGFNEVNTITVNPVPSGATSSVDIVADVYVTTGSAGGSGPFLPLSAGSSYPLTGDLYYNGSIRSTAPASKLILSNSSTTTELHAAGSGGIAFKDSGNNTKMVIDSSGNVGIGTTNPGAKLQVYSTATRDISIFGHGTQAQNNWQAEHAFFTSAGQGVIIGKANASNNTNRLHLFYNTTNGDAQYMLHNTSSTNIVKLNTNGDSFFNGGNVGIGVTDPQAKLEVMGASATPADGNEIISVTNTTGGSKLLLGVVENSYGWIQSAEGGTLRNLLLNPNGGNVGIGITNPAVPLDVEGKIRSNDSNSGDYLEIFCDGSVSGDSYIENTNNNIQIKSAFATSFSTSGSVAMFIKNNQNVGIGTTSPSHKLEIGLTSGVALSSQPAIPLLVSNNGESVDGRVFIQAKNDIVNTASAVGAGFQMTAAGVTSGTASYENSLIFLQSKAPGNQTIHSAPQNIKFYVDNDGTAAGTGANYNDFGDLAFELQADGEAIFNYNVGIGTTSPGTKLDVRGSGNFLGTASSGAALVTIENNSGSTATSYGLLVIGGGNSSNGRTFEARDASGNTDLIVKGNGNVGIGTDSPQYKLDVDGQIRAVGIVNIGGLGVAASGALANVDINDTDTNGTSTSYQPNITFKAAGVLKAQIGKLSGSTNYFTAAKNFDGPVNIIASEIHSGHTHSQEYIFGYEPANNLNTWGLNLVDGTNTANSLYLSAEGLNQNSSIWFGGYVNALLVTRISLNQTLGTWLYDCPDAGTSNVSVKWRQYNTGGYMQNMIDFEDDGDIKNINGSYGTITSDERVKENIVDATSKLDDILSLKVKNFNFIGDDKKQIGLIAQEVEEIFPSWVNTRDTRIYKTHDEDGNPLEEQGELVSGHEDGKSLKVGMEFAILTKAIQEQQEIIESLKQRIEQLEN